MKLNLQCVINDRSLGVWGREIVGCGIEHGIDISLYPLHGGIQTTNDDPYIPYYNQALHRARLPDYDAPSLLIWHPNDLAHRIGKGPKVAWTIFELDRLKTDEIHHIKEQDLVLVPSQWAKDIVAPHAARVAVVPLGNTIGHFTCGAKYEENKTHFMFCGKIEKRKGVDVLAQIFRKAFTPKDNVMLYTSWDNPFLDKETHNQLFTQYSNILGNQFINISWQTDVNELFEIMSSVDCGVFPTRAEGWCFPALDMLAMGKEVIITNYSGQTEFVNEQNARLVPITSMESAVDGIWFRGEGLWGAITDDVVDGFVHHLREVHRLKQNGELLPNQAGMDTAAKFSWRNSIFQLKNILLDL